MEEEAREREREGDRERQRQSTSRGLGSGSTLMLTGNANLKYDGGKLIYTNSNSPPSTTVWWVLASTP